MMPVADLVQWVFFSALMLLMGSRRGIRSIETCAFIFIGFFPDQVEESRGSSGKCLLKWS